MNANFYFYLKIHLKVRVLARCGLNANISFTFQAIKNLSAHPTYLCFGLFCKFWVIWGYIWAQLVFLKGLVKFMQGGNFEDLMLF